MAQQAFINHFQPLNAPTMNKYLDGSCLFECFRLFFLARQDKRSLPQMLRKLTAN